MWREALTLDGTATGPLSPVELQAVSIVICTRDRGALVIGAAASALASVGIPIELIIIDQSRADDTRDAVAALCHDPRLRYERSTTVGVSRARNIGLRLASHPIVLFTDDDVTVPQDWARIFAGAFESLDKVAVAFCSVEARPHDTELGFVPDHIVDKSIVVKSLISKSRARGIGAGMAARRDAVLSFGGFDEELGPGAPLQSGEDRDLAARALTLGWWVHQTPDTYVVHHGFRTWDEGRGLTRRDWYGIGAAYAKQVRALNVQIVPVIAHEVVFFGLLLPMYRALRGGRRVGLKRLGYFTAGFVRGVRTPIDRGTMLYRPRGRSSS
ncbi:MAG: glycosyl transferase family protein [Ilumatobacteraceae bacterium]|nr:glycosyl transferase family protein [Ilumatobacteraceae bacterium]